jgi:sigma-B regulation protein RsbU (phosphoserine phosphatase)
MAFQILRSAQQFLLCHGLYPRTRLARIALGLLLVLILWSLIGSGSFRLLYSIAFIICACLGLVLGYRAFKRHFMWRLRDRLIVTYVFIAVIPVGLLATMGFAAGYIFAGQFSTFVVTTDVQGELRRLESSNRAIAHHVADALRHGRQLTTLGSGISNEAFPGRQITAYYRGKSAVLAGDGPAPELPPAGIPESSLIIDKGESVYLRAVHRAAVGSEGEPLVLVSSTPLDAPHLDAIVPNMGIVTLYGEHFGSIVSEARSTGRVRVKEMEMDLLHPRATSGTLPAPAFRFDIEFAQPGAVLKAIHWEDGRPGSMLLTVITRPSLLYNRLFQTLGDMTSTLLLVLAALAVFFALIEVVALIIGVRLTRTMTSSVAKLYTATQHVNRGDLTHRIEVSSQDQLASLESSFNSMTASLEKLIAEQKEKQRIESELVIAKEVQDLLFPHDTADLDGLELHGVCRPARTVSGDYYDFLPVGPNAAGLAVGDISGKGISAALMMATVHAFIRAHTLAEPIPALAAQAAGAGPMLVGAAAAHDHGCPAPGLVLAMLNQQLYRSTPAQKYATVFLGFYDQRSRQLIYSNAGHLPPFVICADGRVVRLDRGGTVVGLFGEMSYPEGLVTLKPGDIVIAFSDGITEPENDFGEFGEERLAQIVLENLDQPLPRISDAIFNAVTDWIGGEEQPDDMTIVLARAR